MRTESIFNTSSAKATDFLALQKELINDAVDTAEVTGNPLVHKIIREMRNVSINPTCEFEAYQNCLKVENWHNAIDECFS